MKRLCAKLNHDLEVTRIELDERDKLITDHGLVIVSEEVEETNGDISMDSMVTSKKSLVQLENAKLLGNAGDGTLGKISGITPKYSPFNTSTKVVARL